MAEEGTAPSTESTGNTTEATTENTTGETTETSYANGKFKAVSELEKGYTELQKSYSQKLGKFDGAPEAYTLNEGYEQNSTTDALSAWGKENQMNNDGLNGVLDIISTAQSAEADAYKASQIEILGKDADARIQNTSDWVRANLGEEAVEGINSMWVGAKGIEAIENMMKLSQGTAPANIPSAPSIDAETIKAMRFESDEFGNRRMSTDPKFREKVMQAEAQLKGSTSGYHQ